VLNGRLETTSKPKSSQVVPKDIILINASRFDLFYFFLRSDAQSPNQKFKDAIEFIKHLRKEAGSDISIAVAGYPDVHPDANNAQADLYYLKKKVIRA
jgi:hypothetical protein